MMTEQQKIHPQPVVVPGQDVEAPAPLTTASSEKGNPTIQRGNLPQQRTNTNSNTITTRPPKKKYSRSRRWCCKCICWTISLIVVLLIIVGATVGILYLVFHPKLPNYSIDSLRISDLRLNFDMTLYARFNVKITANNPNKKIGIYYEKGGLLSVWYTNTKLCEGSLPKFYQGHHNITKLDLVLTGQAQSGNTLMSALQEQQQTGHIPLDLKVLAPVAIKLGNLKMRKVTILGECKMVVDSLSANNLITIKTSNCNFRFKL